MPALGDLDDDSWRRLLDEAHHHRIVGVLAVAATEEAAGVTGDRREQLAALEHQWVVHTLRAERTTVASVRTLDEAGIDHRVLKGAAFAHLRWPAPEMRVFGDADVLVRSDDLDRAVAALAAAGATRPLPQVRGGFDRRFGKSVTMRNTERVEIDLHRSLVAGPHAVIVPEDDLWSAPEAFEVAGTPLRSLPRHLQLLHAAVHAVASRSPRLASVLDVGFVSAEIDLASCAEAAERWKVRPMVREAGARLEVVVGEDHPVVAWARSLPATAEEEELFALFAGETSFRRAARATVPYIRRRRDRLRFLASLAWPSPAHRKARR